MTGIPSLPPVAARAAAHVAARPSRRFVLGGLTALALAPVLAACGESADGAASPGVGDDAGGTVPAEKGAFPVTIKHKFGSTELTKAPARVVCVGLVEQDALLALGIVPVGVTKWFGDAPGQIFPWATDALGDGALPKVLNGDDGVKVEQVAALKPDLIIGQYAGLTQKEYDLLSKVAPTVAQSGEYVDYGMPWEESTLNIAKAVGRPAAGTKVVDDVTAVIEKAAADHPEFQDKQAIVVTPYEGIFVYGPQDPRGRIMSQLGFTFPEKLLDPSSKEFGWSLSAERTSDLADLGAVVWIDSEKAVDKGTGGLWAKTTAATQGRGLFISDADGAYYIGQSMVTPLSIPYVLERYVPQLAAAIDGDPATPIPPAAA
ncbi:MAG: putative transporter substrate-binding protein [Nocardioidaceae bacterium]|nr:putative transporter substrate-binding protein [Nocardioidaceae bacterium]